MSPSRRRRLKDAAHDRLTVKQAASPSESSAQRPRSADKVPVLLKVAIGLVVGFTGGLLLGRYSRWL